MTDNKDREPLYLAAINCPHEIDHNRVVLHYDDKQPGHNALAQLDDRLAKAAHQVPPGFALVPIKVDNAMIDAANNVPSGIAGSPPHWQWVWDAMLAAAPTPLAPPSESPADSWAPARIWLQRGMGDERDARWISVDERMPESGKTVLAIYQNRLGKLRRIRAQYIAAKSREHNADFDEIGAEYDEERDAYYWPAGWYECIDNWPDYTHVAVCEGVVTHWIEMPDAPKEPTR